jgi:hypothetical protein
MTRGLSKFIAIAAVMALAGAFGPAEASPKPHKSPPGGYIPPAPPAPATNPHLIYALEQLMTGSIPQELLVKLEPIHTLQGVEDLLKASNIAFRWGKMEMRSSDLSPEIIRQLTALPPGEVFVVPQGSPPGHIMVFNVILSTRPE